MFGITSPVFTNLKRDPYVLDGRVTIERYLKLSTVRQLPIQTLLTSSRVNHQDTEVLRFPLPHE